MSCRYHKKEIQKINDLAKDIHDEITGYEKGIERLNTDNKTTDNKNTYSEWNTKKILEEKKAKKAYYIEQLDINKNIFNKLKIFHSKKSLE